MAHGTSRPQATKSAYRGKKQPGAASVLEPFQSGSSSFSYLARAIIVLTPMMAQQSDRQ
jgi:hypothetical protein